ncbi:MAG TPA: nitroreductase family protein [Candidatus Acidoferrum sp.]|nr:nitroreductase family protein [Candidatus Acidoferrum sp.]
MHKRAPTDYPVHDLIAERWSPRAFSDKPVAPDVLASLFEAARWAPSSSNEQPWAYVVATKDDSENFAKLVSVLVPANVIWAQHAPVLALAVAKVAFEKSGAPNRNAQYDVGAASAWLTAEAASRGLFVHQMAGFDPDKARQVFAIPAGWEPIAAIAIGYPGDPDSLPQPLRDREVASRTRKPLSTFVMSGSWGKKAPFLP